MIERNIFVTKETITQPIAYVENTNMLPIVLHIRDYDLPEGAAARAYVLKQSNMTVLCEVSGNDVTIPVASGLFSPGENTMQLRIVQGEDKLLITFPIKVNVKRDITGDDASEPQDNPSVMDQLVAKYGEILEELKKDETDAAGLQKQIGNLNNLDTATKENIVAAVNEVKEISNSHTESINSAMSQANSAATAANTAKSAANAAQTAADNAQTAANACLKRSGGTMTGALNFVSSLWNLLGDDAYFGDQNIPGAFCIKGKTGETALAFFNQNTDWYNRIISGNGNDLFLAVNGQVYVSNGSNDARNAIHASAFIQSSSRRLKENIEDMSEEEAKKILLLEPVTYDYKNKANGTKCRGLIAEDTAAVIPSCVVGDVNCADDDKAALQGIGIDYSKLVPYLIKMIQMQQKDLETLKKSLQLLSS